MHVLKSKLQQAVSGTQWELQAMFIIRFLYSKVSSTGAWSLACNACITSFVVYMKFWMFTCSIALVWMAFYSDRSVLRIHSISPWRTVSGQYELCMFLMQTVINHKVFYCVYISEPCMLHINSFYANSSVSNIQSRMVSSPFIFTHEKWKCLARNVIV